MFGFLFINLNYKYVSNLHGIEIYLPVQDHKFYVKCTQVYQAQDDTRIAVLFTIQRLFLVG